MDKIARKPSDDPTQEKLREGKSALNKKISEFISNLIQFKKLFNGAPNKFSPEKSSIKNPIPADPATIIGALVQDFQEIAEKCNGIINEQMEYSKTRRKSQPKQMNLPSQSQEGQPAQQPAVASSDYNLTKEASNPVNRFLTRLMNPGIGSGDKAMKRKWRVSLLNTAVQLNKNFKKFQSSIVESSPNSIFISAKLLDQVENDFIYLVAGLKKIQESSPQNSEELKLKQVETAIKDIQTSSNYYQNIEGLANLQEDAKQFTMADQDGKILLVDKLLADYKQVIHNLSSKKGLPIQSSFADVISLDKSKPKESPVEKTAQNFLGKLKHQLSPFDKTSAFRLEIYKSAKHSRKLINDIMDLLQEDLNVDAISPIAKELGENILQCKSLVKDLLVSLRGTGQQSQFLNMLENDYNIELNPQRKEKLKKMLEQKQLQDLTKMYTGT